MLKTEHQNSFPSISDEVVVVRRPILSPVPSSSACSRQ
jgi:hypothetical protein